MNPTMSQADLVDYILEPATDRLEREALRPSVEQAVSEIFASRGNPRSIMTPIAINLVGRGLIRRVANDG